jgi:hypothetical protein
MSLIIPAHTTIDLTVFFLVCSIVTYAITEIVKPLAKHFIANPDLKAFTIRFISCAVGAFAGYSLHKDSMGFWIGFGSGSTNTYIVEYVKKRLEKHIDKED